MKIDKQNIKKQAIKTGLDFLAIILLGIGSMLLPEFVPFFEDLEVFVAVATGIWFYIPLRGLIDKVRE